MEKTILTTPVFDAWFRAQRDRLIRAKLQARIDRARGGNFGDAQPVGHGVSEMRIHHGAGYRVYFMQRGQEIVILLAGGIKRTQQDDIRQAHDLAREINKGQP